MTNPWIGKIARQIFGTLLLLWALPLLTEFEGFLLGVVFVSIAYYAIIGLDKRRTTKASNIVSEKFKENDLKENIHFIYDSYISGIGRGHMAITDRWLVFLSRKGNMEFAVKLTDIRNYGYKAVGTGIYQTTVRTVGSMSIGSTQEGKVPVFYVEGTNENGEFNYIIGTIKNKKFFNILEQTLKNGPISKELKQNEALREKNQKDLEKENDIILNNINLIMDEDLNDLDIANNYFLQNLNTYQEVVYEKWTDHSMKLNSLNNIEEEKLKNYLRVAALRGHRMAIAIIKGHNHSIEKMETKTIPSEIAYKMLQSVRLPGHPAIKKLVYSQYKFYRNMNIDFLTEAEILDMTEEYIQVGYKNTIANFLSLKELVETTEKPA